MRAEREQQLADLAEDKRNARRKIQRGLLSRQAKGASLQGKCLIGR
jgi:hypothetical protein